MPRCYFTTCSTPATVEAIGCFDKVFGIEQTVALALCERLAASLRDEVLVLDT